MSRDIAKDFERQIMRCLEKDVPEIIIKKKMRPLAHTMWVFAINRTVRLTGRLQASYRASVIRGIIPQGADVSPDVEDPRIHQDGFFPPRSQSGASNAIRQINDLSDKFVITSGIYYSEHVENNTHETGKKVKYRRPFMFKKTAQFVKRHAASIMQR